MFLFNRNKSFRLSVACFALASSILSTAAIAQEGVSLKMKMEARALVALCRVDYDKFCSSVSPGGGRIVACLQSNQSSLSSECRAAMPRAEALKNEAAESGALPE